MITYSKYCSIQFSMKVTAIVMIEVDKCVYSQMLIGPSLWWGKKKPCLSYTHPPPLLFFHFKDLWPRFHFLLLLFLFPASSQSYVCWKDPMNVNKTVMPVEISWESWQWPSRDNALNQSISTFFVGKFFRSMFRDWEWCWKTVFT